MPIKHHHYSVWQDMWHQTAICPVRVCGRKRNLRASLKTFTDLSYVQIRGYCIRNRQSRPLHTVFSRVHWGEEVSRIEISLFFNSESHLKCTAECNIMKAFEERLCLIDYLIATLSVTVGFSHGLKVWSFTRHTNEFMSRTSPPLELQYL